MIRVKDRAWLAALLSASTVVAIAGCTSSRTMAKAQPGDDAQPKKEYQWKDMSNGKSFFRPIEPSSQN